MIVFGWLLVTASAAELGGAAPDTVSIWGTPTSPLVEDAVPNKRARNTPARPATSPTPTATPEPVIVPRRLQAAMAQSTSPNANQVELDRLLGAAPAATAATASADSPVSLAGMWWMLPIIGLLGGANWWLRKKGSFGALRTAEVPLKIVARQSLGGTSQLLLVEVEDPDGTSRRLLIGTGSDGPRLVSELHPQTDFERLIAETPAEATEATPVTEAARTSDALARSAPPPRLRVAPTPSAPEARPKLTPPPAATPAVYASRRYHQINRVSTGLTNPDGPAPLAERRQDARSLVDEVLASRKGKGWTA